MIIECVLGLGGKYRTHGAKQVALVRTYWCARSHADGKRRNLDLDPSNTSPYTPFSSSTSHIQQRTCVNICMYSFTNPKVSSSTYPKAINASNLARLRTYFFNVPNVHSTGYIHLICTSLQMASSSTTCNTKCVITSKNALGNSHSIMLRVIITSSLKDDSDVGSHTLA
jgi:hypothetical protein